MKRDDLIHPVISGNKYRKLSFVLPALIDNRLGGIISFGGSFSNHVHALAWMCRQHRVPLTLLIRSHDNNPHSPTLADLRNWGAQLRILTPSEYSQKNHPDQIERWRREYPGYLILPEGGSHPGALAGISTMMEEIELQMLEPDIFICPVGTGATLAGMIRSKKEHQRIIGVSALKSSIHGQEIRKHWKLNTYSRWVVTSQWHFGGYGRVNQELLEFIDRFKQDHGILLDPLYNGKAMYAFYQYVRYNLIPPGSRVVFIHTGGLQGWRGYKGERWKVQGER